MFSIVLGVVLLLMVGALVTADRALFSASGEAAAVDALQSSRLFEEIVARQIAAMNVFRAPLSATGDRAGQLERVARSYTPAVAGLRDLTIVDGVGHVLYATQSGAPTLAAAATTVTAGPDSIVVLTVPLSSEGRSLGAVIGRFDARQ